MVNFGMVSEWHRVDNTEEMDTFRGVLRKGDIVQIKHMETYYWSVCTQDGSEPKLVHHFNQSSDFYVTYNFFKAGSVHAAEFVHVGCSVHEMRLAELGEAIIVRINNSRDGKTAPKPLEDIVLCALEAVATPGNSQFGRYDDRYISDIDFVERVRYPKEALDKRLDDRGCSPWHTEEGFESFSWLLRLGDMVEFNRKNVYSHWAVVVSRPQHRVQPEPLVHRYGSGDAAELVKKLIGTIMRSPFQEVIKGSRFRINNSRDKTHEPMDVSDIQEYALRSVGSKAFGKYNLATNNCWHFAMQARYRVKVGWNTNRLRTFRSAQAIRLSLASGDIIQYYDPLIPNDNQLAIYVERSKSSGVFASEATTDKTREVACLSRPDGPSGKTLVSLVSEDDFFAQFEQDKFFYISNRWDSIWKPKDTEDIVRYVIGCNGKEDPYFVIGARYGKKAREQVREIGGEVIRALNEKMKQISS